MIRVAAANVAERLFEDWQIEVIVRDRIIAECSATKSTPPDNYWQAEYQARLRYRAAAALVDGFNAALTDPGDTA